MKPKSKEIELSVTPGRGRTVCISGKLPSGRKKAHYTVPLLEAGIELVDEVFNGLTYLVIADPNLPTAKSSKAIKLGVQVISEAGLIGLTEGVTLPEILPAKMTDGAVLKPPKKFVELVKIWKEIKYFLTNVGGAEGDTEDEVDANYEDLLGNYCEDIISYYQVLIDASCYAFEPRLVEKPPVEIDRLGEVLRGPIYTCRNYEWPMESGYPMVPLIQLDLQSCSKLGRVNLGDGLLQIFMGHNKIRGYEALIRKIPIDEISLEKLLPIPSFDSKIKAFVDIDWAVKVLDSSGSVIPALQIQGYSPPIFCMPKISPLGEHTDIEDIISLGVSLELIETFDSKLGECKEDFNTDGGFHIFGTFHPIQYDVSERPKPLFCFESENGFNFGYGGTGQIFYEKGRRYNNYSYYFDWSCY